jgi:hypothetical protein
MPEGIDRKFIEMTKMVYFKHIYGVPKYLKFVVYYILWKTIAE